MNTPTPMSDKIAPELPFLRRYARALTGAQSKGDAYAIAALEAILASPDTFDNNLSVKAGLFKVFHSIWSTSGGTLEQPEGGLESQVHVHMENLTQGTREALLLHTLEDFPVSIVGEIMDISPKEAQTRIDTAIKEMTAAVSGRILIIEDETIIATDLEGIMTDMGHKVTGIARTAAAARALAETTPPDLILSDIQLADNSSGIDAVNDILTELPDTPVIFITAFPERLLTGQGPEPAFLIAKPFSEAQVRSAVSQAMFFRSTETLLDS
jgi:CheY-like chemotaxis protein